MQERARRTYQAIVDAAGSEFAEKGFQGTTTKTVAARAAVSVGSVYRYFDGKSALLYRVAQERYASLLESIVFDDDIRMEDIPEVALGVSQTVLAYHRRLPGINQVLSTRRRVDEDIDEIATKTDQLLIERTIEMLERLGGRGNLTFTAFNLLSMIESATLKHIARPMMDDDTFLDGLSNAITDLIGARLTQ
ncbi:MAG: TetR/AcrR family transcriptional regulator [Myxococcota bacterium]